ncbi:hypothetical protein C6P40_003618 [Pichia californica]|uniref:Uncharacterized protein n=1 Tax=Pichia californica TaxID=460514 RepID=A0A9P6WGE3_9ASCO|nr:hypothetical protein C6P42_003414 [[Candida] californica]KAG0686665.1 hypothetical protein C6P40_003618 [[Candida] californica]
MNLICQLDEIEKTHNVGHVSDNVYYLDMENLNKTRDEILPNLTHKFLDNTPKVNLAEGIFTVNSVNFDKIHLEMVNAPDNQFFKLHCALGHMHWKNMKALGFYIPTKSLSIIQDCFWSLVSGL